MRRLACAVALLACAAIAGAAAQVRRPSGGPALDLASAARVDRVAQWLKAVDRHEPGIDDAALREVGSWPSDELRTLWIDLTALVGLINHRTTFVIETQGQRRPTEVRYAGIQLRRMITLACAAAGAVDSDPDCVAAKASAGLDADLKGLAARSGAVEPGERDNYVLRRGALLHLDAAIAGREQALEPVAGAPAPAPQRTRLLISDGRPLDFGQTAIHWEIGRLLLDQMKPAGSQKPDPRGDRMVRDWYRATAAWMQRAEHHDTIHLDHARDLFPDDADIAFLSGCQHETYAAPPIQNAVRSAPVPTGFALAIGSERAELRNAEAFFRKALAWRPDMGEGRLRLGRVLVIDGRYAEAAEQLRQALSAVGGDEALVYYAHLFLGAAEEGRGRYTEAREEYGRAAALFPQAQSPYLALSELARRLGDRGAALSAIDQVFAVARGADERRDPMWWYHVAQARDAEALLDALRKPFQRHVE